MATDRADLRTPRHERQAARAPLTVVLVAGLWLLVSWALLGYESAQRAVIVQVIAGVLLVVLAGMALTGRVGHRACVAVVVVGLVVAAAPVFIRYGYLDREVLAYVNGIFTGLLVAAAGVVAAKRAST